MRRLTTNSVSESTVGARHQIRIVSINRAGCVISQKAAARILWTRTLRGAVCTESARGESEGLSISSENQQ